MYDNVLQQTYGTVMYVYCFKEFVRKLIKFVNNGYGTVSYCNDKDLMDSDEEYPFAALTEVDFDAKQVLIEWPYVN